MKILGLTWNGPAFLRLMIPAGDLPAEQNIGGAPCLPPLTVPALPKHFFR